MKWDADSMRRNEVIHILKNTKEITEKYGVNPGLFGSVARMKPNWQAMLIFG
jgi:predicted nucleotidyltransferase